MSKNFIYGIAALALDMKLFFISLAHNAMFDGFLAGLVVALLATGFILTQNPKHLPTILRYSSAKSFERLAARDDGGTYQIAYSDFQKRHSQVRKLFLFGVLALGFLIFLIAAVR